MKKLVYGFNLNRLRRLTEPRHKAAVTLAELGKLGVPAAKAVRVRQELTRLAEKDPGLDHATLLALAKPLAEQLPG